MADAVIIPAGPGDVGAVIGEVRGPAPTDAGAKAAEPGTFQLLGVGEQAGGPGPAGSRGPADVVRVVQSVSELFGAGVDGCIVPVDIGTSPEEVARLGAALAGTGAPAR